MPLLEQNGFRQGRSCNDNMTIIECTDYENAFDKIIRSISWKIIYRWGYSEHIIAVVDELYHNIEIIINTGQDRPEPISSNKQRIKAMVQLSSTILYIRLTHSHRCVNTHYSLQTTKSYCRKQKTYITPYLRVTNWEYQRKKTKVKL